MNGKAKKAYNYYRRLEPDAIHFFNFGEYYIALDKEAKTVCRIVPNLSQYLEEDVGLKLLSDIFMDSVRALNDMGVTVKVITNRNDEKMYDFPDVSRQKREKEWDY